MTNSTQHFSQPEDLLCITANAPAGVPIDALTCAIERAQAVLCLLEDQFEADQSQRLANRVILGALWDVRGTLEQIRTLVVHADDSTFHVAEGGRK
ncbi:hypothetical protein [Pseudomonas sp. RC3H12]|uniref:hypothetical protein n=1 Tax=Pseudomonas sp. RC3H12 TaxID=2834406 RepID=UPI001BDDD31A|nr:hypothetical protein [Pseudomonas sp. RC3H12]QWA27822.1 hypothetical protein KHO27_18080 [Pseudomonas sp. RC3H12]